MDLLRKNETFEPNSKQNDAWEAQITILKDQLRKIGSGYIMFEYTIPRMGKRVDAVFIHSDFVFVMEFKVNMQSCQRRDEDQCIDYALDLKNFHKNSHCASIIPILVATDSVSGSSSLVLGEDDVYNVACTNKDGIAGIVKTASDMRPGCRVNAQEWKTSAYWPTPTITEAAAALCSKMPEMREITRSGADAKNLGVTTDTLRAIIAESERLGSKSLCFVTGVPGSGKTLVALNLVCGMQNPDDGKATLLSGNETLVEVLKESLRKGSECTEKYGRAAASLIQHIPKFRNTILNGKSPVERIVVFDEAQRAWSAEKMARNAKGKKDTNPKASDPELIIRAMDNRKGWAAVVCLIGQGQEIHDGEDGASGWLEAVKDRHDWRVYYPENVLKEFRKNKKGENKIGEIGPVRRSVYADLHLGTSMRTFRGESFAKMVGEILDCNPEAARLTWKSLKGRYPVVLTRNIDEARQWLRKRARGSERYGIVASSGADRLRPYGIFVRSPIKPKQWFLSDSSDIRSSYRLEDTATEFYVQGLELDWTCLAWDANFRYADGRWSHHTFHGSDWRTIKPGKKCEYMVNAYRVLMTRARQGMVIFVPEGDRERDGRMYDPTRNSEFYDGTYEYLKSIGFEEI